MSKPLSATEKFDLVLKNWVEDPHGKSAGVSFQEFLGLNDIMFEKFLDSGLLLHKDRLMIYAKRAREKAKV